MHGSYGNKLWELCITRSLESIKHNHLSLFSKNWIKNFNKTKNSKFWIKFFIILHPKQAIYLIKNSCRKSSIKILFFLFISTFGYNKNVYPEMDKVNSQLFSPFMGQSEEKFRINSSFYNFGICEDVEIKFL